MPTHTDFLAAILAAPAADGPRLVYADWLEEHGTTDADRARGEFIRAQVEIYHREVVERGRWVVGHLLVQRLKRHGAWWPWKGVWPRGWVRGFVEQAVGTVDGLLERSATLLACHALQRVEIVRRPDHLQPGEGVRSLVAGAWPDPNHPGPKQVGKSLFTSEWQLVA